MSYEDYMLPEDMAIEASLRDARLPIRRSGPVDYTATRAAKMMAMDTFGTMNVSEVATKVANMNAASRGIRKEYSIEQGNIKGDEALNDLASSLVGIEDEFARSSQMRKWTMANPQKAQYRAVQDFMKNDQDAAGFELKTYTTQNDLADQQFEDTTRDRRQYAEMSATEAGIQQSRAMIRMASAAEDPSAILNEIGSTVATLGFTPEASESVMNSLSSLSMEPENAGSFKAFSGVISTLNAYKHLKSSVANEVGTINKGVFSGVHSMKLPVAGKDADGNPTSKEFSPEDLPLTPEGDAAFATFVKQITESKKFDIADVTEYVGMINKARSESDGYSKLQKELETISPQITELSSAAATGDKLAQRKLKMTMDGFAFRTGMLTSGVQNRLEERQTSIAQYKEMKALQMLDASLRTKEVSADLAQARGENERIRIIMSAARMNQSAKISALNMAQSDLELKSKNSGGSYTPKDVFKLAAKYQAEIEKDSNMSDFDVGSVSGAAGTTSAGFDE